MRRRALLASLSPLALAGLAGLVALALDPETTVRLATQLGQSALDTGRGVASYLGRAAPLSTALFAALAWVAAGGFRAFVAHRDPSDTRTTAEHAFALVASATVPLVAIFARDRPVVVAGAGVALLAGAGAVFAGRSNARGVVTGSLYAVAPVAVGGVVASLVAGPAVARTATLALPLAVGYALGVASARGRLRLGAAVSALAFAVPAWAYFPPAAEAAGFQPGTVGYAVGFAVAATLFSLPSAAIGYATTRTADAARRAGASPAASAVEQ
ncbi:MULTISPECIES: hypothetical protein [unclassified Haloferax]|uniref:hypothetical protein n=1 Tax=unclassified Haloferax TaxID=2625095 RepID=UPI0002B15C7C|nr:MULTISPECIES: hypothetical protein [unclassified Haloferax]ELZ58392.1 hypothetical protein C460_09412 [Haloferax sp. ATCC BAA-646]ELZ63175.1 hypothetical protein C458_16906 [Haloferax sp. ATCC BAA-644]ELZ63196.1 hypothetical protein C459_10794 [Haloferax sp. ATCC BAA-645]